ncbi:MAG: cytochrome c oxidase subunit 3 [Fimbriimonadaceae bacterium]|nr:cytochrome c oxidase subunit 3 [Fimbriimonadaceae bacterium]
MAGWGANQGQYGKEVYFQYEDLDQQQESYVVGMWAFLVTEVMFFGPLFFIYALYRWKYQTDFYLAHNDLDYVLGGVNTMILLFSSYLMALAVFNAQKGKLKAQVWNLLGVLGCAFGFLIVKTVEYSAKFTKGYFPDGQFMFNYHGDANPEIARIFYSLYFTMTGLHGVHVIIGILVIGMLTFLVWRRSQGAQNTVTDYVPTEMVGLYWHFVDLVWIFLYPLFYLMPK